MANKISIFPVITLFIFYLTINFLKKVSCHTNLERKLTRKQKS
jgi:hypothetical protein